ncbi:MAG: hypothetical protein JNM58_14915 [Xanthomonadaceae bacterium]|nr:hypothetical protein [Xanthomonadaceae bacterium]
MKTGYVTPILLATTIAAGTSSAQTPPVEYVGTTAESDAKNVAIVAIDQNHTGRLTFKCYMSGAYEETQKLRFKIDGQSKIAILAPGTYTFHAKFEDSALGHSGFTSPAITFEGGKQYRVACVRKRYKVVRIESTEITPPPSK